MQVFNFHPLDISVADLDSLFDPTNFTSTSIGTALAGSRAGIGAAITGETGPVGSTIGGTVGGFVTYVAESYLTTQALDVATAHVNSWVFPGFFPR